MLPGSCLPAVLLKKWIGLDEGTIVKTTTESVSKTTGEISSLDRYYISSLNFLNAHIAEQCARAVRRHWGIENDLHYVLDVNFYQDRTQCKNANYLQNRVLLNKWALGMIRKLQKEAYEVLFRLCACGAEPIQTGEGISLLSWNLN